jgi:hypothetical protein
MKADIMLDALIQIARAAGPKNCRAALAVLRSTIAFRGSSWLSDLRSPQVTSPPATITIGEGLTERTLTCIPEQRRYRDSPSPTANDFRSVQTALETVVRSAVPEALPEWPIRLVIRIYDAKFGLGLAESPSALISRILSLILEYRDAKAGAGAFADVAPEKRIDTAIVLAGTISRFLERLEWKSKAERDALSRRKSTKALAAQAGADALKLARERRLRLVASIVVTNVDRHQFLFAPAIVRVLKSKSITTFEDSDDGEDPRSFCISRHWVSDARAEGYLPPKNG